jgi:hypothetical protein
VSDGDLLRQGLGLLTSVLTLYGMKLAGDRRPAGWMVGLLNQAVWFAFIVAFGAWTLLFLNAALTVVYARNYAKWRREER